MKAEHEAVAEESTHVAAQPALRATKALRAIAVHEAYLAIDEIVEQGGTGFGGALTAEEFKDRYLR